MENLAPENQKNGTGKSKTRMIFIHLRWTTSSSMPHFCFSGPYIACFDYQRLLPGVCNKLPCSARLCGRVRFFLDLSTHEKYAPKQQFFCERSYHFKGFGKILSNIFLAPSSKLRSTPNLQPMVES